MKKLSFEQAYHRLKEIHEMLETNELMDIEKIITLQKEAKELYEQLDHMLKKAEIIDDQEKKAKK